VTVIADFGASTAWTIHVAGIEGAGDRPDNTSDTPYASGDAALYREEDVVVTSGTDRYLALNTDPNDAGIAALIHPGMHVYVTTAAGTQPLVRLSFSKAFEKVG
jgi:hypothetical protein